MSDLKPSRQKKVELSLASPLAFPLPFPYHATTSPKPFRPLHPPHDRALPAHPHNPGPRHPALLLPTAYPFRRPQRPRAPETVADLVLRNCATHFLCTPSCCCAWRRRRRRRRREPGAEGDAGAFVLGTESCHGGEFPEEVVAAAEGIQ